SPFNAVVEKIPLSVGQVNIKPQHLVFDSHFGHRVAKTSQIRCGKQESPHLTRVSGCETHWIRCKATIFSPFALTKAMPLASWIQGAGAVHFACDLCKLWTTRALFVAETALLSDLCCVARAAPFP